MGVAQPAGQRKSRSRAKSVRVMREITAAKEAGANGSAGANGHDVAPPFKMPAVIPPTFPARVIDIRDHGAIAGGRIDCTQAIADAIAACAKTGGGRVVIPAGEWFTGAIHLK